MASLRVSGHDSVAGIGGKERLESRDRPPLPRPSPDDFLEPGGRLAVLAATFGNSWRLPDSEVRLQPPGSPGSLPCSWLLPSSWLL